MNEEGGQKLTNAGDNLAIPIFMDEITECSADRSLVDDYSDFS